MFTRLATLVAAAALLTACPLRFEDPSTDAPGTEDTEVDPAASAGPTRVGTSSGGQTVELTSGAHQLRVSIGDPVTTDSEVQAGEYAIRVGVGTTQQTEPPD